MSCCEDYAVLCSYLHLQANIIPEAGQGQGRILERAQNGTPDQNRQDQKESPKADLGSLSQRLPTDE